MLRSVGLGTLSLKTPFSLHYVYKWVSKVFKSAGIN